MTISHMVAREILHRKLNFALGVLAVIVAIGSVVGAFTLLDVQDIRTQQILDRK